MKRLFLVEASKSGHNGVDTKQFLVKAKTFEAACDQVLPHVGNDYQWKLCGVFDLMEIDNRILTRTQ